MSMMKFSGKRRGNSSRAALLAGCVLAGTGGISTAHAGVFGYGLPGVHYNESAADGQVGHQLLEIARSLQTTNAELARALGVSRQALYNWRGGQRPSAAVQKRLDKLTSAAQVIVASGVLPKQSLARLNSSGLNFWQAVAGGADAHDLAMQIAYSYNAREAQRNLMAARVAAKRSRGTLALFDINNLE